MCIAIYKPAGRRLLDSTLEACWDGNPDGAGFMYAEKNKLHIIKGLMTFEDFKEAYAPHENKDCVLHFRIKTHGKLDETNTHPFQVNKNLGVVHNGIISKVSCDSNKDCSDTWHFTDQFLKSFADDHPNFFQEETYKQMIESYIGASKLIFMNNLGDVEIYNESMGEWNSDCWFSNKSYNAVKYVPYTYKRRRSQPQIETQDDYFDRFAIEDWDEYTKKNNTFQTLADQFKVNETVRLSFSEPVINPDYDDEKMLRNTLVTIMHFGDSCEVTVKNPLNNKIAKTKTYYIQKVSDHDLKTEIKDDVYTPGCDVVFSQNFNHFRVGMVKKIDGCTSRHVIIKHEKNPKTQWLVPKIYVAPVKQLLLDNLED